MNRRLAALAGVALVLVAFAGWWFALRDRGDAARSSPTATKPELPRLDSKPQAQAGDPTPQGMAPRWLQDEDPVGPLRLEGQVIDEHGAGVGDAVVALTSVPERTVKTEGDGTFAFDKLVGREYALSATAGDLVGGPVGYTLTADSDPVVIRLVAGAKLAVTVLDADAKPVAGATVRVDALNETSGTTGTDGVAIVKPVLPGWVRVRASADGYAPGTAFTQVGAAGSTATTKVTLRKGFDVSGRVVDEAGKPIASAHVVTSNVFDIPGGLDPVVTDAKGAFKLPPLAPGTHTLVATDGEHAPGRSPTITIEDKPVTNIEIVMATGGVVAGLVVDTTQKPVAFATVRIASDTPQLWLVDSRQATTDSAGAFTVKGLARSKHKVRADAEGAASTVTLVDLATVSSKRDVKLVLDVKGTISGIVVDETNQPVAEVSVNAFPDILGGASSDAMMLAGMSSSTTDGGGRFTIRGLPDGAYRLRAARSQGNGFYDWGQDGVPAKTGASNVKITLAAPGSVVGKLVLETTNAPPILANVQLGSQPAVAANKDGTFTLTDVTPGKWDLYVRGPEFAVLTKRDVTVAPGKPTDIGTLTLVRGRKVVGRVVDASGAAVAGAKVKSGDILYSMQGAEDQLDGLEEMSGIRSAMTDHDGRFTLIGVGKKATNVMADHAEHGRSNAAVIADGTDDPAPITLTLRGYGQVVGKVMSQGKPVGGATITASPKGGGSQMQIVQSEPDGSFTLSKVAEGTVVLSAMQQNMMSMSLKSTSTNVVVTARKQTKVTIDIPVGSIVLTVQVKPLPNQKVDSAQVFLFRGVVAVKFAKEVNEAFLAGGVQGMKFWLGEGKPMPEFDELVAGDYSICTIPIAGDLNDTKLQQRMQQHMDALAVHCKQVKVTASPTKQTVVHDVPTMSPIPEN